MPLGLIATGTAPAAEPSTLPLLVAALVGLVLLNLVLFLSGRRRMRLARRDRELSRPGRRIDDHPVLGQLPRSPVQRDALPEGFTETGFLADVARLFREAHTARGTGRRDPRLSEAAREVIEAAAPGFERVWSVSIAAARLRSLAGSADGAAARVEIVAVVDEVRDGEPAAFEQAEVWQLGLPPGGEWRVLSVDRRWRRLLERPVLPPAPEARALVRSAGSPELGDDELERLRARIVAVLEALDRRELPADADALVREELATWLDHHERFECHHRFADAAVALVPVVRTDDGLLTVAVRGTRREWIVQDGAVVSGDPDEERPVDERWTFDDDLRLVGLDRQIG